MKSFKELLQKNILLSAVSITKKIAPFIPVLKDNIVLGRTACLGSEILRLRRKKGEKTIAINQ
jgi:hypothetical protein